MRATAFNYRGYTFKPVGNILGGWKVKTSYTTWAYHLDIDGYTHEDFYRVAKRHRASCDVFECEGKLYVPCNTKLVGLVENTPIKSIYDYDRWYQ